MTIDITRQEILFFVTFLEKPDGITQNEIYHDMAKIAEKLGWPKYLQSVPMALEPRIEEAEDRKMIKRSAPLTWKPSRELGGYINYLINKYLDEDDKIKMRANIFSIRKKTVSPAFVVK